MQIRGRSAFVTGGGNGIGRAIALALAREGAAVAVADLDAAAAASVAEEIAANGGRALACQVDVASEESMREAATKAWQHFGSIGILVNNAGVLPPARPLLATTDEDWRWVFDVNVRGMLHAVRFFAPRFVEGGEPCWIVNTGSEHSLGVPHLGAGLYTASKHAVLGLSDVLRRELPATVGVSVLCPGMVASSLWRSTERRPEALGGSRPGHEGVGAAMERFGMPAATVAEAVVRGIREQTFLVVTHPHAVEYAESRWQEVAAAFAAQAPRYEGDEQYEVSNIMARLRVPKG